MHVEEQYERGGISMLVAGAGQTEIFRDMTTHASRTLMVPDLTMLLDAVPRGTSVDYKRLILEDNILRRKSASARSKTLEHLRNLYALNENDPVFAALQLLAEVDPESIPMLALLSGATRDALLRCTAEWVSNTPPGAPVSSEDLRCVVEGRFPDRFSANTLIETGRRALSSWTQSGHLTGRAKRVRDRATASVGSVVFALFLGHLSGVRGLPLYGTFWADLLDASVDEIDDLAFAASQRGMMEYRRLGEVAEFGFSGLLARTEGLFRG